MEYVVDNNLETSNEKPLYYESLTFKTGIQPASIFITSDAWAIGWPFKDGAIKIESYEIEEFKEALKTNFQYYDDLMIIGYNLKGNIVCVGRKDMGISTQGNNKGVNIGNHLFISTIQQLYELLEKLDYASTRAEDLRAKILPKINEVLAK